MQKTTGRPRALVDLYQALHALSFKESMRRKALMNRSPFFGLLGLVNAEQRDIQKRCLGHLFSEGHTDEDRRAAFTQRRPDGRLLFTFAGRDIRPGDAAWLQSEIRRALALYVQCPGDRWSVTCPELAADGRCTLRVNHAGEHSNQQAAEPQEQPFPRQSEFEPSFAFGDRRPGQGAEVYIDHGMTSVAMNDLLDQWCSRFRHFRSTLVEGRHPSLGRCAVWIKVPATGTSDIKHPDPLGRFYYSYCGRYFYRTRPDQETCARTFCKNRMAYLKGRAQEYSNRNRRKSAPSGLKKHHLLNQDASLLVTHSAVRGTITARDRRSREVRDGKPDSRKKTPDRADQSRHSPASGRPRNRNRL